MSSDTIVEVIKVLPTYLQAIAVIAGGVWGYRKFIHQRANEPATDIDIDLKFVGIQDDEWIIEITSFLSNKSLVRVEYQDFQVTVRYIHQDDKIEDGGEEILYQLKVSRKIDERINGNKRFFANVNYLNPKQEFKHRYVTFVPVGATFVWVQCKFFFTLREAMKVNSQRIFRVPAGEVRDMAPVKSPSRAPAGADLRPSGV